MQLDPNSIIVKYKKDSQKKMAYRLDDALSEFISKNKPSLKKLYGELNPETSDLIALTKKMARDFSLDNLEVRHCPKADEGFLYHSYAGHNRITFGSYHYNKNDIEVAIHEFAHIICDTLFKSSFERHGALFISVLRWLMNYYELISYKEFDSICEYNFNKIQRTDETIVSIEFINENIEILIEQFEKKSRESSYYKKNNEIYIQSFQYKENGLLNILYVNHETKKGTLVKRKLFGFEDFDNSIFKHFKNEELLNFYLISPAFLIDYDGYKTTSRDYGCLGYKYYKVDNDFHVSSNYENVYNREDCQSQLKCLTRKLKSENIKYKRCFTYEEFDILSRQLKYEIRKRINEE